MSPAEAQQRIAQLRAEVARHDELYYRRATPEITDFDYDKLKQELAGLEKLFPEALSALGDDTPTQRIGDDRGAALQAGRVKGRVGQDTAADMDRIGALAERYAEAFHRSPSLSMNTVGR